MTTITINNTSSLKTLKKLCKQFNIPQTFAIEAIINQALVEDVQTTLELLADVKQRYMQEYDLHFVSYDGVYLSHNQALTFDFLCKEIKSSDNSLKVKTYTELLLNIRDKGYPFKVSFFHECLAYFDTNELLSVEATPYVKRVSKSSLLFSVTDKGRIVYDELISSKFLIQRIGVKRKVKDNVQDD